MDNQRNSDLVTPENNYYAAVNQYREVVVEALSNAKLGIFPLVSLLEMAGMYDKVLDLAPQIIVLLITHPSGKGEDILNKLGFFNGENK